MAGADSATGARTGGLLTSLKQLVATLVAVVQTRLELLASEVQAEKLRLTQLLLLCISALFFLACAVLLLTVLVVVALWDTHRLLAIGGFAALYLGMGVGFALAARARASAGTQLFVASLAEFEKDRDRLSA
jgi:uncharacterized membrane protein YqjE